MRTQRLVLAVAVVTLVSLPAAARAQIPAAPGSSPRDERPGGAREVVPLPPIPEHMAVPTPTEEVQILPSPIPTAEPSPRITPRAKKHRKSATPKPAKGIEKL